MTKKKLQCFTKKDNAEKPYVYCIDGTTKKKPRTIIIKRKKRRVVKGDGNILTKIRGFRSLSQPTIKPVVSSFRSLSKPKNMVGDGNILPKIRGFRKLSQSTIKPVVASLKNTADWGVDYQRPYVEYQDGWQETNQFWINKENAWDEWMAQDESDSENEFLYERYPVQSPRSRRESIKSVMDDTDGNKEKPRSIAERTRVVAKMKEAVRKKGDVFFTWLDREKSVHELARKAIPTYSSPAMTKRFKKNYDRLNPYGELLSLKRDGSKKQGYPYPIGESLEANRIRHNKAVEGAMEVVDNFKRKAGSGGQNKKPEGTNARDRRAQLAEWYGRG